jgi:hypothetical protein
MPARRHPCSFSLTPVSMIPWDDEWDCRGISASWDHDFINMCSIAVAAQDCRGISASWDHDFINLCSIAAAAQDCRGISASWDHDFINMCSIAAAAQVPAGGLPGGRLQVPHVCVRLSGGHQRQRIHQRAWARSSPPPPLPPPSFQPMRLSCVRAAPPLPRCSGPTGPRPPFRDKHQISA